MKRIIPLLLAALIVMTACGGRSESSDSMTADSLWATNAEMDLEAPEEEFFDTAADMPSAALPEGAKVIRTASLDLETKTFDSTVQALDRLTADLGGWYESRSLSQGGSWRSLTAAVRVPEERLDAFLTQAGETAHLVSRSDYIDDVSENYYDSEARLTTQRTKLERLQTLLAQAENMEDIIALESALSETELQIEYLTGELRRYDSQIQYATVTLWLQEVYRLSTDTDLPRSFPQRLGDAFSEGFQQGLMGLEDLLVGIAANWLILALLAAVIAAAVVLLRRRRRKRVPPPADSSEKS